MHARGAQATIESDVQAAVSPITHTHRERETTIIRKQQLTSSRRANVSANPADTVLISPGGERSPSAASGTEGGRSSHWAGNKEEENKEQQEED